MHGIILLIHILAATVWTGGHLILATTILPGALRRKSVDELLRFESGYERVGIPALILLVLTGLWLAFRLVPDVGEWVNLQNPLALGICIKLTLLALTAAFAVDARLRIIPGLSEKNLNSLAWHIVPVTVLSVLFVATGVSFRTGWLFA
ncbi:MAG: CopD family protein [Leptospirales bacterium]|jgi:putative copper export protein